MADHSGEITQEEIDERSKSKTAYEEKLLKMGNRDFRNAVEFLKDTHRDWLQRFRLFHNANSFDALREKNLYPVPFMRDQLDTFVAGIMHPLWSKEQPCKLSPGPKASSENTEAKQQLHAYQNSEDGLKQTHRQLIEDVGLYGVCAAKTDFVERSERLWSSVEVPTTQQMQLPDGSIIEVPSTKKVSIRKNVTTYLGPRTERIDPFDVFFDKDKRRDDTNPIMIRSFVPKSFFGDDDVFINKDEVKSRGSLISQDYDTDSEDKQTKRWILNFCDKDAKSKNDHMYVEWQGMLDKKELFEYLGERIETDRITGESVDKHDLGLVREDEEIFAIVGIANGQTVVRVDTFPFELNRSNVVLGIMQPQEFEVIGSSIGAKSLPAAKQLDVLAGIMFKSLRLAVNRGHAVDINNVAGGAEGLPDLNSDGWVLQTLGNPNQVHTIIDQPGVVADLYQAIALTAQWGKDSTGQQDTTGGKADPNAETLGENELIANKASIRGSDPLETIEDTLIIPITKMRDEINQEFLEEDYLIEVIGEDKAKEWVTLTPDQIRSHTRFICESSGREFNRAVITQQALQLNQLAPGVVQTGQAVRGDKINAKIALDGFGWSTDEVEDIYPNIKSEKGQAREVLDKLLAKRTILEATLTNLQLETAIAQGGLDPNSQGSGDGPLADGGGLGAPSQQSPLPDPTTTLDTITRAEQSNQTQVEAL